MQKKESQIIFFIDHATPTKPNLWFLIKARIDMLQGAAILKQVTDVLRRELQGLLPVYKEFETQKPELFNQFYTAVSLTILRNGEEKVELTGLASKPPDVSMTMKRVMGATVPSADVKFKKAEQLPIYSAGNTDATLDEARRQAEIILENLPQLVREAAIKNLYARFKTIFKRQNAINELILPEISFLIKKIDESLEQNTQEDLIRMKMFKNKKMKN